MKVLVTGAEGFIAKNLIVRLNELEGFEVKKYSRQTPEENLPGLVHEIDTVIHLAGVNRPQSPTEFTSGNTNLTERLCQALAETKRTIPVIFSSSTQAVVENPYGKSKGDAEQVLWDYADKTGSTVYIYRLPNVFGKWCKPNYNSAVATFCHNIARGLPIKINDPSVSLALVYIDDVVDEFLRVLNEKPAVAYEGICAVPVEYVATVGELVSAIERFHDSRDTLVTECVGAGLMRALYSTYVSYLPTESFGYSIPKYGDERGVFVEMLKTKDSGQFSFFTAHSGITRGGHYHHTKTEKFLVIKGSARFGFRHILTDETHELYTSGERPQIVETVPGWSHDITNVGEDEMVVMLWANEIFDRARPDTYSHPV
ncbi:MAG TPA: SDR family oxidoreductase [Thiotrichaceae bacterium]|nr:SDR family oxidoreductase [Thiotrichaceae bacterium]